MLARGPSGPSPYKTMRHCVNLGLDKDDPSQAQMDWYAEEMNIHNPGGGVCH